MGLSQYQTKQDMLNKFPDLPGDLYTTNPSIPVNTNFLTNNKFQLKISRCPTVTYFCQRANIPAVSFGTSIQGNSTGISIRRPGTAYTYEDLQVGFIVNEDMTNWIEIYQWMRELGVSYKATGEIVAEHQKVATGVLLVTDSKYKPIVRVTYMDMYPTFLSGVDFDSALTDTDAVIATTTFAYTHYEIEVLTNP